MLYPFPLTNEVGNQPFIQWPSGFSDDELASIRAIGDDLEATNVKLYGEFDESNVKASGAHFKLTDETRWVYDCIAEAVVSINSARYSYSLSGFAENFYYLTYKAGDHFNWHVDAGRETAAPRKLSLSLHLSDPSEYEGGEFDILISTDHVTAYPCKGMITAFPSHKIHRIRPVTTGIRRALTAFASGPSFR